MINNQVKIHTIAMVVLLISCRDATKQSATKQSAATQSAATTSFSKHTVDSTFVSEGVAVADVNNDGKTDIIAGPYWYEAPGWKQHRVHSDTLNPIPGYSTSFHNYSTDVNGDNRADVIRLDQPGEVCMWYENAGNTEAPWKGTVVIAHAGNESPAWVDVDGDGRMDLICNDEVTKQVIWLKSPGDNSTEWKRTVISFDSTRGTHRYTHGLGWGDMNLDGKNDVVIKDGWWENPGNTATEGWKFHEAKLGDDCANMFVYDVDGDGDQDVLSSSAHDYGIWWHEQVREGNNTSWKTHTISKLFSQSHALEFADINGDGHPDLITGKRYKAHNEKDPGASEPAVLYWFEFRPGKNPEWIPHEIDNNSGVGNSFIVQDINGDNLPDIIVSNKKGVHFFEQVRH